jgi:alpha-1,4-digalacturonate transport system permease protein
MRPIKFGAIIKWIVIIFFIVFCLLPLIWILLSSFKGTNELYLFPPTIIPKEGTLDNYRYILSKGNFLRYFFNSLFVAIAATILTVFINTMSGYALAKFNFRGRNFFLMLFISTLMIPLEVIMIPIFKIVSNLGLANTLLGIIIPPSASPTGIFIIRQYILTIPDEIIEAAYIDGAPEWKVFTNIIVPMARPVIAVLTIFSFMWRWNDYLWPLIVLSDPKKYTIQLAIANFMGQYTIDWNSILAMGVVGIIPLLIIYIIFQKQFISGVVTSGLKG